jgi:hypothetical protein
LAIYQGSEHSANEANQNGLAIYAQSERVLAYPARSNEAGLAQYHRSEWGLLGAQNNLVNFYQKGLVNYHQIERNSMSPSDTQFNYQQGHWFGQ